MQLPDVNEAVGRILSGLHGRGRFWVTGPAGSGRATLARALQDARRDAFLLEPPPLADADASAAILALLRRVAGGDLAASAALVNPDGSPTDELRVAVQAEGPPIFIRLRDVGWTSASPGDATTRTHGAMVRQALALVESYGGPVVWLADWGVDATRYSPGAKLVSLPSHSVVLDAQDWSRFRPQAESLLRCVDSRPSSPIVWRFAIGALALGADVANVADSVRQSTASAVSRLALTVCHRVQSRPELLRAVQRLLVLRGPVPESEIGAYLHLGGTELLLVTEGLAYGAPVRVAPLVGRTLAQRLLPGAETPEREALHREAADLHAKLDGKSRIDELELAGLGAWVEKVHHLGHGGVEATEEWSRQEKFAPQLFWERARALSQAGQYQRAADVYEKCIQAFPEDGYAHHYLAYNLNKAGEQPATVAGAYAAAVRYDRKNPWWNSRRVAHLIESGRWVEAKRAWHQALDALDPDGSQGQADDGWLVAHLHYWAARAWQAAAVWYEARNVLSSVSVSALEAAAQIRDGVHVQPGLNELRASIQAHSEQERARFESALATQFSGPAWHRTIAVWQAMVRAIPGLPPPAAREGEDGPCLVWSQPGGALEWELDEETSACWAAHDHIREEGGAGRQTLDGGPIVLDEALLQWLRRMASHA